MVYKGDIYVTPRSYVIYAHVGGNRNETTAQQYIETFGDTE